jgi:hypothetical protein
MGRGDLFAESLPDVTLRAPSRRSHGEKVLYEQYWLASGL